MTAPDLAARLLEQTRANPSAPAAWLPSLAEHPRLREAWEVCRSTPTDTSAIISLGLALEAALEADPGLELRLEEALARQSSPVSSVPGGRQPLRALVPGRRRMALVGIAAAAVGAIVLVLLLSGAFSSGQESVALSRSFSIGKTDSTSAVHARMTLVLGRVLGHPACGTSGTSAVFPVTLTLRNDDDTSWEPNSDRMTHPALELFTTIGRGPTNYPTHEKDPVIVADRNCSTFTAVAFDYMDIPAHHESTLHLEIQSPTRDPHQVELTALLRADSTTPGDDRTSQLWDVRLDGTGSAVEGGASSATSPSTADTTQSSATGSPSTTDTPPASSGPMPSSPEASVGDPISTANPLDDSESLCSFIAKHVSGQGWYSDRDKLETACAWSNPQDYEMTDVQLRPGNDPSEPITKMYRASASPEPGSPVLTHCDSVTCMVTGRVGPGTVMVYFDTFGSAPTRRSAIQAAATSLLLELAGYCTPTCPAT
ncbi:hypothetical protein ACWEO4_44675 [Streptomyces sp. NPDC004393]